MGLELKYFILKPRSKSENDVFAMASRAAMEKYAAIIHRVDPIFAEEIKDWVEREVQRESFLGDIPEGEPK